MTLSLDNLAPSTAASVFIARQPIFDATDARVAYELLYRQSRDATNAGRISEDLMCSDTALHAVVSIGLDRLTAGAKAFVNITREHLLGELHKIFRADAVVLELLESIDGDDEVVEACQRARADGYTLALDDYDGRPSLDVLLPLVSIVKLDVLERTREQIEPQVTRLRAMGITVLAERVETMEMHDLCLELGCTLFQGYVYSRPETLGGRSLSVEQTTMLKIVSMLGDVNVTDQQLADAFRSHPSLSVALLRIVNAASFGSGGVESIPHAIRLIGRGTLSRWLLVMLVTSVGTASPVVGEAVSHALTRARFCELLAVRMSTGDASASFLVGLLSRLDVLLGESIETLLQRLPVSEEVRNALLHFEGPHARILELADAYERARWETVATRFRSTDPLQDELGAIYSEATWWAAERLMR